MAKDKSELSKKLHLLNTSTFENPFSDNQPSMSREASRLLSDLDDIDEEDSKKIKRDDRELSDIEIMRRDIKESDAFFSDRFDNLITDFDLYLENRFDDEEDSGLKNSLISLGRKYARDTSMSGETSEITKAYSGAEKKLDNLLGEIREDKKFIQKDIENMRMMRTKNFKTLSELVNVRKEYHNTELGIIKEINKIKKDQFELSNKFSKNKALEEGGEDNTSRAIQQLFGMGRGDIISSVGGFEGVSGAPDYNDMIDNDEYIQQRYFADKQDDDGDKFLKYENAGVEHILLIDEENDSKDVIAEDSEGNIVYDYPLPSNISELDFVIDIQSGTATDNLHRKYKVRKI